MIILKRTFKAKTAQTEQERQILNCDPLTSEYMPSYKYVLRNDDGTKTSFTYRTKAEAIKQAEGK